MTLTRRRVRVSKYIAQVNHMGTDMGTKFMLLYFIYIKQLLNAIKWRCCQTKPNTYQSAAFMQYILNLAETERVMHVIHNR